MHTDILNQRRGDTINVRINVEHPFGAALDVVLIAPDLTEIRLTDDNGGNDDNYTRTVFDDAAGTSIVDGTAPFTGRFRPDRVSRLAAALAQSAAPSYRYIN